MSRGVTTTLLSELVWLIIGLIALVWELVGVFFENRTRVEPLTEIVRDRYMRRFPSVKIAVLFFWLWLGVHFFIQGG